MILNDYLLVEVYLQLIALLILKAVLNGAIGLYKYFGCIYLLLQLMVLLYKYLFVVSTKELALLNLNILATPYLDWLPFLVVFIRTN